MYAKSILILVAVAISGSAGCSSKSEPAALIEMPQSESSEAVVLGESSVSAESVPTDDSLLVDDDGQTLWLSPTDGESISLQYLPLGTQLLLHLRPAELLGHREGEKIVAALGPWGAQALETIAEATSVDLEQVESLVVAVHSTVRGELHFTWRLELTEPIVDGTDLPAAAGRVCYLPPTAKGRVLVCCHAEDLQQLTEQGDEPALFPRDMQKLLALTDRQRLATLVLPTRFLQTEGHKLLVGKVEQLRQALYALAGNKATTIAISAHWSDQFFLELQSTVALNVSAHLFAREVSAWLPTSSESLRQSMVERPVHDFGRPLTDRLPAMVRLLGEYTRGAEVEGVSVQRCYLPIAAGHNLLMASELLLALPEQTQGLAADSTKRQTVQEKLDAVTSMSFPKDTLEQALALLSEDIGVPIKIAGRDLQLEGITKNQSFGIDLRDKTAEEILQAIVAQANPDRTATSLADPKQKLVYVLQNSNTPAGVIVVTTRTAAASRGEALPKVFVAESE